MGFLDGLGGGGGGGLLSMLDPLGLLKQGDQGGKPEDKLLNLIDPAGIFSGMIKQEINKSNANSANDQAARAGIANEVVGALSSNDVQAHKDTSGTEVGIDPSDPATQPGTTELPPQAENQKPEGYAPSNSSTGVTSDQDLAAQHDSVTVDQSNQTCSSQSAATGVQSPPPPPTPDASQQLRDEIAAAEAISSYFNYLDGNGWSFGGHSGVFDRNNLERVFQGGDFPPALRNAAQYLLDHDDVLTRMVLDSAQGNGGVTQAGILAFVKEKRAELQALPQPKSQPPPGSTPPPGGGASQGTGGKTEDLVGGHRHQTDLVKNDARGDGGADVDAKYGYQPATQSRAIGPSTSLESALDNVTAKLGTLEERMDQLTDVVINGSDADARKAQAELSKLQRQWQGISNLRQQMYTLLSDLQKSFHEMAMHAISNTAR